MPPLLSRPDAYLPHRPPFLFLDAILDVTRGEGAAGLKRITADAGPFPPFLLFEAMAQLSGVAASGSEGEGGFLAGIDRAEVAAIPAAGDAVIIRVTILKSFGRLYLSEGEARVGDHRIASALLTMGIGMLGGGR